METTDGFGWDGREAEGRERVPVVDFDFEAVFRRLDGEPAEEADQPDPRVSLREVLSPQEMECALEVTWEMARRASPRSWAARRSWRNPVTRQRMIGAIRLATRAPEARRRRSESALRAWRVRDREKQRQMAARVWGERRAEYLARMHSQEYRRGMSEQTRARWRIPGFREKRLAQMRSPEARQRESLALRRYFEEHPKAREQRAEGMRRLWQNPVRRKWRAERIRAGWAAARAGAIVGGL